MSVWARASTHEHEQEHEHEQYGRSRGSGGVRDFVGEPFRAPARVVYVLVLVLARVPFLAPAPPRASARSFSGWRCFARASRGRVRRPRGARGSLLCGSASGSRRDALQRGRTPTGAMLVASSRPDQTTTRLHLAAPYTSRDRLKTSRKTPARPPRIVCRCTRGAGIQRCRCAATSESVRPPYYEYIGSLAVHAARPARLRDCLHDRRSPPSSSALDRRRRNLGAHALALGDDVLDVGRLSARACRAPARLSLDSGAETNLRRAAMAAHLRRRGRSRAQHAASFSDGATFFLATSGAAARSDLYTSPARGQGAISSHVTVHGGQVLAGSAFVDAD